MLENLEPVIATERPRIWRYTYSAGSVRSKFLIELRANKKIMGTRCSTCNWVYVPAKPICGKCLSNLEEWVEVSDKGTLMSYTVVYQTEPAHPMHVPFIYGVIKLDGADTSLAHMVSEVDAEDLRIGMRLQAVFKEERQGSILDIKYFKPLS
jgi:hypothetical protein